MSTYHVMLYSRGDFREPMTYYRNLSVSRKIIEPDLNMPEWYTLDSAVC